MVMARAPRARPPAKLRTRGQAATAVDQNGWQTFSTIVDGPGITETCTCEQAGCEKFRNGWQVKLDETVPLARIRADYLRTVSRRKHGLSTATYDGGLMTVFTFDPGTPCFQDHRDQRGRAMFEQVFHRRSVRQTLHVVSAGHSSAVGEQINRTGRPARIVREHSRPSDWAEHAAESWNRMAEAINR